MAAILRVLQHFFPKAAKFPRSVVIEAVDVQNLFTLGNVPGDGNCLFHSVAIQLECEFNSNIHSLLRKEVCKYYALIISNRQYINTAVAANPDMFSCSTLIDYLLCTINTMIPTDTNIVDPKYKNICKDGEYGDQDDITAIALICNIRIIVLLPDYGGQTYTMLDINPDPLKNLHTIFLYCNNAGGNGGHYQPLLLTEQINLHNSHNKLVSTLIENSNRVKWKLQNVSNKSNFVMPFFNKHPNKILVQKYEKQRQEDDEKQRQTNEKQRQKDYEKQRQEDYEKQRQEDYEKQRQEDYEKQRQKYNRENEVKLYKQKRLQEQEDYEYAVKLQKQLQEQDDYEYALKLQKQLQEQDDYEYAVRLQNQMGGISHKLTRRYAKSRNLRTHITNRHLKQLKGRIHTNKRKIGSSTITFSRIRRHRI